MPLENEMKKPRKFIRPAGVLNIGMAVNIILYIGMGFFGYIRYGKDIESTITINLNKETIAGSADHVTNTDDLARIVQLLLALSIFFTHSLQCYVAIDISWNEYISPKVEERFSENWVRFWEYVVRTVIVVITCKLFNIYSKRNHPSSLKLIMIFDFSPPRILRSTFGVHYFFIWGFLPSCCRNFIPSSHKNLHVLENNFK